MSPAPNVAETLANVTRNRICQVDVTFMTSVFDDITAFRNYLQAERGMAVNTVLAYGRDLERFGQWTTAGGLTNYLQPTLRELTQYLGFLRDEQLAPPSVARHLVALKMFYRFLRLEERVKQSA